MNELSDIELSPGQLLIWLGMQRHPDAPIYNTVTTFRIGADIEADAFDAAFQALVDESDALRSTFLDVAGAPKCFIRKDGFESLVEHIDLSKESRPEAAFRSWALERSRLRLDVSKRVFDTVLVRLGPGKTAWYLNQHHLVADAWSTRLVYERVADLYTAFVQSAPIPDAEAPSFSAWVKKLGDGAATRRQADAREYWQRVAEQVESSDPLTFYGQGHDAINPAADRISVELGPDRADAIRKMLTDRSLRALNDDLTLFQIVATVLFAFLFRASGHGTLAIGAPSLNRTTPTERRTIGLMMEMLMLRVEVEASDSLATLYTKVRDEAINFLRHGCAGASTARLVRTFSVLLNFVRGSYADFGGAATEVDYVDTGAAEPHNALRIQVRDFVGHGNFSIDFDFNHDTFAPQLRAICVQQFLRLLDAFILERDTRIAELDLLPSGERNRLLVDLNRTVTEYPQLLPLHELFDLRANANPDRPAVIDGESAISCGQLRRRSNRLARELIARGVQKGQCVALLLEPGVDFVVAALAAMKAGAAYMPIDTEFPEARRRTLLETGRPAVVIAANGISLPDNVDVVRIPADGPAISRHSAESPNLGVTIDDVAYVLFTSGSTGMPKGVVCKHRGVVNLLNDIESRKQIRSDAACSIWTDIGFDVSVYELFAALCQGGTLYWVPRVVRADPVRLYDWCCEMRIECAYLPPFVLNDFVAMSNAGHKRLALERLLVGVEPIPLQTLQALAAANPELTIINGYGPTETTICATLYTVPPTPADDRRTPIGQPVCNNRVYLLDEFGQPVPHGQPGELFIGGDGVACGYLDDDELTAERFVDDPFDPESATRLFRTGDRVRYLSDDNLEFIGRVDHQIKVRGHRIEPAEVERRLVAHPDVREALVVARTIGDSGRTLVAYLISDEPVELSASDWYRRLQPELPGYMIPSAYVSLRTFPQTRSGKIDRSALPKPDADTTMPAFNAPETSLQSRIAAIWCSVLGIDAIGIHDHFIDIGGDSIQALQIAARAHDSGIRFSAGDVFEFATIAALAERAGSVGDALPRRAAGSADLVDAASRAGISEQDLEGVLAEFGEESL